MPTYTHECTACEHVEEIVCRIADRDALKACSVCGKETLQRMGVEPAAKVHYKMSIERYVEYHRGHLKEYAPPQKGRR